MAIGLLAVCLFGLFFLFLTDKNNREALLKSVLVFSVITVFITEVLGLFQSLNYSSLLLIWLAVDVFVVYLIYKRGSLVHYHTLVSNFKNNLKSLSGIEWFLLSFSLLIIVAVFLQGLFYPPNNWDAMAYHMPRVVHWIQQESLAHFRTSIYPQLNLPPFSEQIILNVSLLLGSDYLANSVQLFYLITLAISLSLLAKEFGVKKFTQLLIIFLVITLPEIILLASSTHNEIVVSFFIVSSIYFFLKTSRNASWVNFLFLGISLGLAVATKPPAYIYLSAFVALWLLHHIYLIVKKRIGFNPINYALVALLFVLINWGHYSRNYQLTGSLFGTDAELDSYYLSDSYILKGFLSTTSKNMASQFGLPKIAPLAYKITTSFHYLIGQDINDPKTSSEKFSIDPLATHENNGANPYFVLLMIISLFWMFYTFKETNKRILIFSGCIVISFLLFCLYLKWQPWVKLHVPFLILYTVVMGAFLTKISSKKLLFIPIISGFVFFASLAVIFNYSRPIITKPPYTSSIKITDSRYQKYFSRFFRYQNDYEKVSSIIQVNNFSKIGLMLGSYDMEYQLFLNSYRNNIKPIHLNTHRLSASIPVLETVDCIVTTKNETQIKYDGETYYNATKDNDGYLYLFLKR